MKLLLVCGGQSTEHAVSRMSCVNIYKNADKTKYDVKVAGITKEGEWYDFEKDDEYQVYDAENNKYECFSLVRGKMRNVFLREFVPEIVRVKKSVSYGYRMEDMLRVGRDNENEVVLPQNYISRKHAILEADENFLYVTDKGSLNGTFVNGERISANVKTRCRVQDEIAFADISFIVV